MVERKEVYLHRVLVLELAGIPNNSSLTALLKRYEIQVTGAGIPAYALIRKMYKDIVGTDEDSMSLDAQLKREKVLKERINNQERLSMLIPKEKAKSRMRTALMAVANMIRYGIKTASPRVAICQDIRDCENILIDSYGNALEDLETKAKNITWEDESATSLPRGIKLASDT